MISIGMIFQYSSDEKKGLLMLSDGKQISFTQANWTDEDNKPAVGLKIAYSETQDSIDVRVATAEDIEISLLPKSTAKTADEYISEYTNLGFKKVQDRQVESKRVVALRSFITGESEEVIITQIASKITITKTRNGKTI